jgi:hypothetical protein
LRACWWTMMLHSSRISWSSLELRLRGWAYWLRSNC